MAGNRLITFEQLTREMNKWWLNNWHYLVPTEMFIEGQYNWERPEYDDHA